MKAEVYGREFKSLVDRASLVIPKRTALELFRLVKFTAENNMLTAECCAGDSYLKVNIPATIIDPGVSFMHIDQLKKILSIQDMITIESTDDRLFRLNGTKKKYETAMSDPCDFDSFIEPFGEDYKSRETIAYLDEEDFVKNLAAIDCCRVDDAANILLGTFNFNSELMRLVACDSHRICIANVDGASSKNANINLQGITYKVLKGLRVTKDNRKIGIYNGKKFVYICGDDYIFAEKAVEGNYFNIDNFISEISNYSESFTINTKEMKAVAKEYKKALSADDKRPMIIFSNRNGFHTAIQTADYRTIDLLEECKKNNGIDAEFIRGLNPAFIVDAMEMFGDTVELRGNCNEKHPIAFVDEKRICLILPVHIMHDGIVDYVKRHAA